MPKHPGIKEGRSSSHPGSALISQRKPMSLSGFFIKAVGVRADSGGAECSPKNKDLWPGYVGFQNSDLEVSGLQPGKNSVQVCNMLIQRETVYGGVINIKPHSP